VKVELTEEGRIVEHLHDLVVLSLGMVPAGKLDDVYHVSLGSDGFIDIPSPNSDPCITNRHGIFAAGAALGPMDIVDSIVTAGAAATAASAYIRDLQTRPPEREREKVYA